MLCRGTNYKHKHSLSIIQNGIFEWVIDTGNITITNDRGFKRKKDD